MSSDRKDIVKGKAPEALSPAQAALAERAAARIRDYQRTSTAEMLEVGKLLNEVKVALPHGAFGRWLESEVGWTQRTAQNYMRAAEVFAGKSETVSHLPPNTLYKLAAPSIPESVRETAIASIEDPARPPVADIHEMVERARQEAKEAARQEAKARRKAKLSSEEVARGIKAEERRRRKEEREREEREAAKARQRDAAAAFVQSLDDTQAEALRAMAEAPDAWGLVGLLKAALDARRAR